MITIDKKSSALESKKHPLDRQFKTIEEAAQAKTDYVVNVVLKDFDFTKPIK